MRRRAGGASVAALLVLGGCSAIGGGGGGGGHRGADAFVTIVAGSQGAGSRAAADAGGTGDAHLAGVAVDRRGNVFVSDQVDNQVRRLDPHGGVTTVAGTGRAGFGGDGGPATAADLSAPAGLAVDAAGNLLIADRLNNRIRRVDVHGVITTVAGNGDRGYAADGGPATGTALNAPVAVAVDGAALVVADTGNRRVRRVDVGGRISTVAGGGSAAPAATGVPATTVALGAPTGVAVAGGGAVLAATPAEGRVVRVAPDGTLTVVAGEATGTRLEDADGPAAQARLSGPTGVAVDGDGLVLTEAGAGRVRRVDRAGAIRTVAQSGASGAVGPREPVGATTLAQPGPVAVGPSGDLFVVDGAHDLVRRVPKAAARGLVPPVLPMVDQLVPATGGAAGGTAVRITGHGFSPLATTVRFGDQPAQVMDVRPDTVFVLTPAGRAGTDAQVTVTTGAGSSRASPATTFTYVVGWEVTGSLGQARFSHTATRLDGPACAGAGAAAGAYPCGAVLVTGGAVAECDRCDPLASTELYDLAAGTWRPGADLATARLGHTASLLADGTVLVAGGEGRAASPQPFETPPSGDPPPGPDGLASAELYDPGTNRWTAVASMAHARFFDTATVLDGPACHRAGPPAYCGQVLVVGGTDREFDRRPLASAELYDPRMRTWSSAGNLAVARSTHTATLLADGRVLVAGGLVAGVREGFEPTASAEIYDPATGAWATVARMAVARQAHTATLLPSGKVLVVGGSPGPAGPTVFFQSAELFDPASGAWAPTPVPGSPRAGHAAVLLPSGRVLVAGGGPPREDPYSVFVGPGHAMDAFARPDSIATAEIYDPATGGWTSTRMLDQARALFTLTILDGPACRSPSAPAPAACGAALAVGGAGTSPNPVAAASPVPLARSELYR